MKGSLLIIFYSKHGHVRRYVDILGNALGCDAVPLDKFDKTLLGYDKYLYIAPVHGGVIDGFKKLGKNLDAIVDRLTVCGVGMLPFKAGIADGLKDRTVSVTYEARVPVFYAQGGFDANELTRMEKVTFGMMTRQLSAASALGDEDAFILKASREPFDEVKLSNIKPLVEFLDGKQVDIKLYSPAAE